MRNYTVSMEFIGHHQIDFQAETDEEAIRMVENGELYQKDKQEVHESEVCEAISLQAVRNEEEADEDFGFEGLEEIWTL